MSRKRCAIQASAAWPVVEATTHLKSVGVVTVCRGMAANDRLHRNIFGDEIISSLPARRRVVMMTERVIGKLHEHHTISLTISGEQLFVMRVRTDRDLSLTVCQPVQRRSLSSSSAHIVSLQPRESACSRPQQRMRDLDLDERWQSGNEDINKSAQAGIRFSLPLQVSRCQGAFNYIIH